MNGLRRHLNEPLPTATAVVLAVLVALAASISDGIGPVGESANGRVPSSLVASGRVLASALSTVAERLEEDWSAPHRRVKAAPGPIVHLAGSPVLPALSQPTHLVGGHVADATSHAPPGLVRFLRNSGNLPPPALA